MCPICFAQHWDLWNCQRYTAKQSIEIIPDYQNGLFQIFQILRRFFAVLEQRMWLKLSIASRSFFITDRKILYIIQVVGHYTIYYAITTNYFWTLTLVVILKVVFFFQNEWGIFLHWYLILHIFYLTSVYLKTIKLCKFQKRTKRPIELPVCPKSENHQNGI